jgi:aldose 1-epimerase
MVGAPSGFAPPSGRQFEINLGAQRAVVTEVGATLRAYTVAGAAVIDGFDVEEMSSAGRGQVLAPWPNRLGDGRYSFEGHEGHAPLDEPASSNAIHGLVRWLPWQAVSQSADAVALRCVLHPQPAYPWRVALVIEYRLGSGGLSVETTAVNLSGTRAPFGIGFHPYVTVGTSTIDDARLALPGRARLLTDDRALPIGEAPNEGTSFDFTAPRPIGDQVLDTAYADLSRGTDGRAVAELASADGERRAAVWMDASYRYLMVYTGDRLDSPARRRAVALEPMTCPPDALRSGRDLIVLDPGAEWRGTWGITPSPLT